MTMTAAQPTTKVSMALLSRLLLGQEDNGAATAREIHQMTRDQFDEFVNLAGLNHVIVRGLGVVRHISGAYANHPHAAWADEALSIERSRIRVAVSYLRAICAALEQAGHDGAVIKSLDHWPDLGSDLDLYTDADPREVIRLMKHGFNAALAPRSWGDRLANKWNFLIPGLPEAVEIHMRRLGQTGEQIAIASRLMDRTRIMTIDEYRFRVPSASDRVMISTLQRMYRHFYFRLCDIVDSASLAESGAINYRDLREAATHAGIWEGVATYMVIVSDYVKSYRGWGVDLPRFVRDDARFGGGEIYFHKDFLRIPIMPQSAKLYGTQLAGLMRRRELHSGARLSLLPWLATAAVVGQKITGSDKGIW
jgi:hypothetical protein